MRFVLPWLVLALIAPAFDANACMPFSRRERPQAFRDYDAQHGRWLSAVGRRLAQLPDNEIAWTGALFVAADDGVVEAPPATPTTGVGRLMRHVWCDEGSRCPDAVAQWMAVEPDNLFVLALAMDGKNAALADEARERLARATRYDDYTFDAQVLADRISALPDITPPPEPPGYEMPACTFVAGKSVASYLHTIAMFAAGAAGELGDDPALDASLRLRIADILLASPRSAYAASHGAKLGVAAATSPIDRERYCQAQARADAQEAAHSWLVTEAAAEESGQRAHFHRALRARNALDAVDAIASQLPANRRPDPVDPERVAACVAGRD